MFHLKQIFFFLEGLQDPAIQHVFRKCNEIIVFLFVVCLFPDSVKTVCPFGKYFKLTCIKCPLSLEATKSILKKI